MALEAPDYPATLNLLRGRVTNTYYIRDLGILMRYIPFLLTALVLVLMAGGADAKEPEWNYNAGSGINSVAISADGEYIVAGSDEDQVLLFHKDSNTPLWSYTAGDGVYSVAISSDGETIVAGSLDNNVYLFDKDSSTPLWSYGTGNRVWSVAISQDGETIAAGSWDNRVYLFDKDSGTPLWSHATSNFVFSVDISADGEMIAAGSDKAYLFDRNSSTPRWSYSTGDTVRAVDLSEDFFGQQQYTSLELYYWRFREIGRGIGGWGGYRGWLLGQGDLPLRQRCASNRPDRFHRTNYYPL